MTRRRARPRGGALLLPLLLATPAAAQETATVTPGPQYRAGGFHALMLGDDYRDLWTTPARVPLLDLRREGGGLRATETGGGNQTESLRFRGADGREYAFRSVDKRQGKNLHPDLQGTLVEWTLQDQVSSLVPAAHPVASRLTTRAGLLVAQPRLVVMPDDPALGEFRAQFAGRLGVFEERPDEPGDDEPRRDTFGGAAQIKGTEEFLEDVEEGPEHGLDAREWLAGRLVDLLVGDWDRHEDQYRWARYDTGDTHRWRPIPRDRDYAFVDYDGTLLAVARQRLAKAVRFTGDYPRSLIGLTINAQFLDRRFLGGLDRAAWDSVTARVRAQISDAAIDAAIRELPAEHYALRGPELASILRQRRDDLPEVADRFYRQLSREAEVHGTDIRERAAVRRFSDGSLEVALYALEGPLSGRGPYVRRLFSPRDTREVRVFLRGGADQALVEGTSPGGGIKLRILGGGGDDTLEDRGRGAQTGFYDDRGENRFVRGPDTVVDERPFEEPEWVRGGLQDPPRNWGGGVSRFTPSVGWRPGIGIVVGGGPAETRRGFRRYPFAHRWSVPGLVAPEHGRLGVEAVSERRFTGTDNLFRIHAQASELEVVRFHGLGNDTPGEEDGDRYRVWLPHLSLLPEWDLRTSGRSRLRFGPALRLTDPDPAEGNPAFDQDPRGLDRYFQGGARAELNVDRRDAVAFPRRGAFFTVGGSAYPLTSEEIGPFADTHAEARGYLPLPLPLETTLAVRAGGRRVWGEFPFPEAAFIGGQRTVRGYHHQRFGGDAAAYGSAEARVFLTRANLRLVKGDLGVLGLADAGRVWLDGDSPGGWHTAWGAGMWFGVLDRATTVSAFYARGERDMFYVRLGLPF